MLTLLKPSQVVRRIGDIRPAELKARGITAIITDLDNTLVPWRRYNIAEGVIDWLAELERENIKIVIASNTMHRSRLKQLADTMRIPFVDRVRKPWVGGFRRSMQLLETSAEQTAVVGDQLFTDVLCGNKLNMFTILLRPPIPKDEFISTVMLRVFENAFINIMQHKGLWPKDSPKAGKPASRGQKRNEAIDPPGER
ncbi:MAG: YqeG family HAD IIIA-type phosphatase [Capsulimonadaceae bacterium]|nr:YqeG family HAD IIIA-type phosphatase [Capsulimonadaceae bacterium]